MTFAILGQLLVGWLLADFLSGLVHWLEDRVLSERMALIGRLVVAPNRQHHATPLSFLGGGVVYRNGTTWLATALVALPWLLLAGPSVVLGAAVVGGCLSSQLHYWAHAPRLAPVAVQVLQEVGLLQSPKGHARHHRPPQTAAYCVITDWLNPVLDRIGLWRLLDRLAGW